jgi:hypothetical protein
VILINFSSVVWSAAVHTTRPMADGAESSVSDESTEDGPPVGGGGRSLKRGKPIKRGGGRESQGTHFFFINFLAKTAETIYKTYFNCSEKLE